MGDPTRIPRFADDTTLPRTPPGVRAADVRALSVLFSPDIDARERVFPLVRQEVELGRAPGGQGLSFDDPLASRHHATLRRDTEGEDYVLLDEESRNGTYVNGERVSRRTLRAGDILRLGDTVLRLAPLELEAASWRTPPDCLLRGRSRGLRDVLHELRRAAPTDISVLIEGETGTGKELVARELHRQSGRAGPFVALNSAAIPADLLESELFGCSKGAYSGAARDRKGLLLAAQGGTFLLDEVGELPLAMQAKLLRVLEEKRIRRVGDTRESDVDVRFVFATNRDLARAARDQEFRRDLFARLAQWHLVLPALRDRPEDLLPIVQDLVRAHGGDRRYRLSGDFYERLALHDWPFNVRELVSVTRKAMALLSEGGLLGPEHLPPGLPSPRLPGGRTARRDEAAGLPGRDRAPSAQELTHLLEHYEGSVAAVARHTGRHRRQVYRWLRKHGVNPESFRPA